jgi:hypothetical protein
MRLFKEVGMSHVLRNWIFVGTNAYDEYTFVPWLNKNVYRRTVDLSCVCLL